MSEKWTKGPWEFVEGDDNHGHENMEGVLGTILGDLNLGIHVCRIWGDINDDDEMIQERANAHLIAAAPEMYAALKELCDSCMGECENCQVSRILKKARGEA